MVEDDSVESSILNRYQIEQKLGCGAYGQVWRVRNRRTNILCALKKISGGLHQDGGHVYREVSLLRRLNHGNVVKLYEVLLGRREGDVYLVFQLLESDLFAAIRDRVLISLHRDYIVYQLAVGIRYLHSCGVLHRDLKPSNILLASNCRIKFCDFGLARTLGSKPLTQNVSTRWYRAPQILLGSRNYGPPADMWSLGCLIYQLYSRRTLLPGTDTLNQLQQLFQFKGFPSDNQLVGMQLAEPLQLQWMYVKQHPIQHYFEHLENQAIRPLLQKLLQYDPRIRLTADELINSDFLQRFKDFQPQPEGKTIKLQLDSTQCKLMNFTKELRKMVNQNGVFHERINQVEWNSYRGQSTKGGGTKGGGGTKRGEFVSKKKLKKRRSVCPVIID